MGRPALRAQRSSWSAQASRGTWAALLQQISVPRGGAEERRLHQGGVVVDDVDDAEEAFGVAGRIEKDQVELLRFQPGKLWPAGACPAPRLADAGQLAHGGEGVALDEARANRQVVQAGVVLAHLEGRFGELTLTTKRVPPLAAAMPTPQA